MNLTNFLRRLLADARGISAVEYGIMIGVVGVALALSLGAVGTSVTNYVTGSVTALTNAGAAPAN